MLQFVKFGWAPSWESVFSFIDPEQEPELVPVPQRQLDLDLLKQFDLNWEFGPCLGITRLERWERADELGLNPPLQVYDLLQHHLEDPKYLNSLWHEYPL
ncbi:DNA polymerase delta subunit 4 isoform X2 [Polypterus senegalus]|uniref:DNA polymerase delta subunit 4 isoform X2 n=1 Tax=Polypterus senegalus TaxID=55291 RepID=UPI001963DCFD|nr:DNA polymerase delta subunit 4 isoform X2 [Polypterus senegalus]